MSRGALAFALFALAAGAAIGYVAGSTTSERASPLSRDDEPSRRGEVAVPVSRAGSPPPAPVEVFLPEVAAPPSPTGDGVIRGRVTSRDGNPVAGVLVRADLHAPYSSTQERTGPPEDRELAELARDVVEREVARRSNRREARTEDDGTYEIAGLPVRGFNLKAYKSGYRIHPREGRSFLVTPDAEFDFTATAVGEVELDIALPDGSRPEGAWIQAVRGSQKPSFYWRSGRTVMMLEPGTWTFHVAAGGHRRWSKTFEDIEVEAGAENGLLRLQLEPKPGVHGRILDVDVNYVRYEVRSLPLEAGAVASGDALLTEGRRENVTREGDDWTYFVTVGDGRRLIGLVLEGNRVADFEVFAPTGTIVERDFRIPAPDPSASFILRIVGPNGGLLDGHATSAYQHPKKWVRGSMGTPLADGTIRVPHPPQGVDHPGPGGRYLVVVTSKYHGKKTVEYGGPSVGEVTVRFEDPAALTIHLNAPDAFNLMKYARARLHRLADADSTLELTTGSGNFDASGRLAYDPIVPGRFDLVIEVQCERSRWLPAARRALTLGPGPHVEKFDLPTLSDLTVLVDRGVRQLTLQPADPAPGSFGYRVSARGTKVTFRQVPPGRYVLASPRGLKMNVTVPTGGEVTFVPE